MASKKRDGEDPKLALYEKVVATNASVTLKGATHPYTALNGNMSSYLHPSGKMALRLPEGEREKFLVKYKTKLFEAYGVVQKEYVTVPDALLENTKELRKYFDLSCEYTAGLKAKPSQKRK
jgi:hypothetical protein